MCAHVKPHRARHGLRILVFGLAAAGVAGCSADTTRFSEGPFSSPYDRTASVAQAPSPAQQSGHVDAQPLPPPQNAAVQPMPAAAAPVTASYHPPSGSDVTGSVRAPAGSGSVTVEAGDTVYSIARRYGVPPSAILQANNLTPAAQVRPGQRLIIPRDGMKSTASRQIALRRPSHPQPAPAGSTHVVQSGETLSSLGRLYGKSRAEIASANRLPLDAKIRAGQSVLIPGVRQTRTAVAAAPKPAANPPASVVTNGSGGAQKLAANDAQESAQMANAKPEADPEPPQAASGETLRFRWPTRGRVIAGFGPKPNGQQNDGINLSVPEGTSIQAAEGGVVAYAGSELKGYGNLVLVRHPNGFVTAYAHASQILVKRGDPVKRGQVIARAGQTGNVSSPQLHFEIRKGKDPVDPMQYLAGG